MVTTPTVAAPSRSTRDTQMADDRRVVRHLSRRRHLRPTGTFLSPLTMALKSAPARNLGTDDLGTLMDAPVAGFLAVRAGRSDFSNTPKPVIATLSPLATATWIVSRTAFTASVAVFLSPIRPEIASIRSRLFMSSLLRSPVTGGHALHGRSDRAFVTSNLLERRRYKGSAQ